MESLPFIELTRPTPNWVHLYPMLCAKLFYKVFWMQPSMVVHASNPSTLEAEAGGL
jgi:hypothetical protein